MCEDLVSALEKVSPMLGACGKLLRQGEPEKDGSAFYPLETQTLSPSYLLDSRLPEK